MEYLKWTHSAWFIPCIGIKCTISQQEMSKIVYPSFSTQINNFMVFLQKQLNIVGLNILSRAIAIFLLEETKLSSLNLNGQARVPPLYPPQSEFFVLEIHHKQNYQSKEDTQNEKKTFLNYSSCNSCRYVFFFRELSLINIMKIYSASVLNYFGFTRYIKKFK